MLSGKSVGPGFYIMLPCLLPGVGVGPLALSLLSSALPFPLQTSPWSLHRRCPTTPFPHCFTCSFFSLPDHRGRAEAVASWLDLQGQSGALGTGGWGVLEEHVFAGREKSANDAPWSCARKILGGLPATAPEPTPQCGEGAPDGQVRQSPTALHTDTHGPTVTTSRDPE